MAYIGVFFLGIFAFIAYQNYKSASSLHLPTTPYTNLSSYSIGFTPRGADSGSTSLSCSALVETEVSNDSSKSNTLKQQTNKYDGRAIITPGADNTLTVKTTNSTDPQGSSEVYSVTYAQNKLVTAIGQPMFKTDNHGFMLNVTTGLLALTNLNPAPVNNNPSSQITYYSCT